MNDRPDPDRPNLLVRLESITLDLAYFMGTAAVARIGYGTPAYTAFGLGKQQARQHRHSTILSLSGKELLAAEERGECIWRRQPSTPYKMPRVCNLQTALCCTPFAGNLRLSSPFVRHLRPTPAESFCELCTDTFCLSKLDQAATAHRIAATDQQQ